MANNIPQLKTDIIAAFTANLDADTRTKLSARFVRRYNSEWLASGLPDNPANRGKFAAEKLFDFIGGVFTAGSADEIDEAQPAPEVLE